MNSRAEDNAKWVRDAIGEAGLTDWIAGRAYTAFIAKYMPCMNVDQMFNEIVKELA